MSPEVGRGILQVDTFLEGLGLRYARSNFFAYPNKLSHAMCVLFHNHQINTVNDYLLTIKQCLCKYFVTIIPSQGKLIFQRIWPPLSFLRLGHAMLILPKLAHGSHMQSAPGQLSLRGFNANMDQSKTHYQYVLNQCLPFM